MIKKIDPIEHIRKRRDLYLGKEGLVCPEVLATNIATDALMLGVEEIVVSRHGAWWVVRSRDDWFELNKGFEEEDVFNKIVPVYGAPLETFRREILLMAFADNIFVVKDGVTRLVKGSLQGALYWYKGLPLEGRAIAFEIAAAPFTVRRENDD